MKRAFRYYCGLFVLFVAYPGLKIPRNLSNTVWTLKENKADSSAFSNILVEGKNFHGNEALLLLLSTQSLKSRNFFFCGPLQFGTTFIMITCHTSHGPVNGHIKTAEQRAIIQQYSDWCSGRWWVGCYIWYSEEVSGRAEAPLSPLLGGRRPLLAVPNAAAHPSTASVPSSYYPMWHYCFFLDINLLLIMCKSLS